MTITAWLTPSPLSDNSDGTTPYVNPGNAATADGVYAVTTVDSNEFPGQLGGVIPPTGMPTGSIINGIEVLFKGYTSASNVYVFATIDNNVIPGNGTRYALIGITPPNVLTGDAVDTTDTTRYAGGSDMSKVYQASGTMFTAAELNSGSAYISIGAGNIVGGVSAGSVIYADYVAVRFHYSPPPTSTSTTFGTSATSSGGTVSWASPSNALANDSAYTSHTTSVTTANMPFLNVSGFDFSAIPAETEISGISVSIEKKRTGGSTGNIRDSVVSLTKTAGVAVGSNLAATATNWGTTDSAANYGGSSNLWGTTWTLAEIQDSGFGVTFQAVGNGTGANRVTSVDYISIVVSYFAPTGETVTADKLSFTQTLQAPSVNALEKVATPKQSFAQAFYNVNAIQYTKVDKLSFTQTLRDVSLIESTTVFADKLSFTQALRDVNLNAVEKVLVEKQSFAQSLREVNAIQKVTVDKLSIVQSLFAPNLNATEKVAVDTQSFNQSLFAPITNNKDATDVEKLEFAQESYTPTINVRETVSATKLSAIQTLYTPNVNATDKVSVPKLAFVQTLPIPSANGAEVVIADALNFYETLFDAEGNSKTQVDVEELNLSQLLFVPTIIDRVQIPKLTLLQTLHDVKLIDKVSVDHINFNQSLLDTNVNATEKVSVAVLELLQTLRLPKIDDNVDVGHLNFTQSFNDVNLNERSNVESLSFVQQLYSPSVPTVSGIQKLSFLQTLRSPFVVISTVPQVRCTISWVDWEWNEEGESVIPVRHSRSGIVFLSKRITGAKIDSVPLISGASIKLAQPVEVVEA